MNAAMILFGWLQDAASARQRRRFLWLPIVAGVVPWVAITIYCVAGLDVLALASRFICGIFMSLFVFFNIFALNQWLSTAPRGGGRAICSGEGLHRAQPDRRVRPGIAVLHRLVGCVAAFERDLVREQE